MSMNKGDNVLIFNAKNENTVLATFLENVKGNYLFENIKGKFTVSQKSLLSGVVKFEIIED